MQQSSALTQSKLEHVQLHLKSMFHTIDPKIEEDSHKTSPAASEVCFAAVVEKIRFENCDDLYFLYSKGRFQHLCLCILGPEMSKSRKNGETGRAVGVKVRQDLIFTAKLIFFSAI